MIQAARGSKLGTTEFKTRVLLYGNSEKQLDK